MNAADVGCLKATYLTAARAAKSAQDDFYRALCNAFRFQPGDIIKSKGGKLAQISKLYVATYTWAPDEFEVRFQGVLLRKDGSVGERLIPDYHSDWTSPTLHLRAEKETTP